MTAMTAFLHTQHPLPSAQTPTLSGQGPFPLQIRGKDVVNSDEAGPRYEPATRGCATLGLTLSRLTYHAPRGT